MEMNLEKKISLVIFAIVGICAGVFILFTVVAVIVTPPNNTKAEVDVALQYTQSHLRDVDYNGSINCIDYAVIFYEQYPNSKMIRCWDNKDFNHLLNRVGDRYIEPQARDGDPYRFWPDEFEDSCKVDETYRWAKWATRKTWSGW